MSTTDVYVAKPFRFTDDGGAVRDFAVGVHTVEESMLEHWWFKAHAVRRVNEIKDPAIREQTAQPVSMMGMGPYPVVEQTKAAEEGDLENTGDVETTANSGVFKPEDLLPPRGGQVNEDFERRLKALEDRSTDLDRREADLRAREEKLPAGVDATGGPLAPATERPEATAAREASAPASFSDPKQDPTKAIVDQSTLQTQAPAQLVKKK